MSVRTPILTTSSEICAFAAVPEAAKAMRAATAAAVDFMVSSPWLFVEGFKLRRPFYPLSGEPATPTFGHTTDARDGRRQGMTTIRFPDKSQNG
jgi:hypothetical protein